MERGWKNCYDFLPNAVINIFIVEMCEIDEMVVEVAKKYLPTLSKCFSSEKLTLHIGDGFEYMRRRKNNFDLIITGSIRNHKDKISHILIF